MQVMKKLLERDDILESKKQDHDWRFQVPSRAESQYCGTQIYNSNSLRLAQRTANPQNSFLDLVLSESGKKATLHMSSLSHSSF